MNLGKTIKKYKNLADVYYREERVKRKSKENVEADRARTEAREYEQLAEWLTELRDYRNKEKREKCTSGWDHPPVFHTMEERDNYYM